MMKITMASKREDEFGSMAGKMGSWVDQVLGPSFRKFSSTDTWAPAINLYEDDASFFVVVDLAGVAAGQIDLRAEDGVLMICGRREMPRVETQAQTVHVHMMEIDHGLFRRAVELPPNADTQSIEATYRGGFLSIRIPRK
jgi:HSP20 family protein